MADKETIVGVFLDQVKKHGDREALLERRGDGWASYSWNFWSDRAQSVAAALKLEGVQPDEHVAIFSYSRRQWVEADIGILKNASRTVTVYHNLNADTVEYILGDCQAKVIFAEGPIQLEVLFAQGKLPASLEKIVFFVDKQTPLTPPGKPKSDDVLLEDVVPEELRSCLISFEDFIAKGKAALEKDPTMIDDRLAAIKPDDVAKIVYTSGTTGDPKGSMLTNRNFLFVVSSVQKGLDLKESDIGLLFLPLAHVYAQLTYHSAIAVGFTIAFSESMLTAVEDAGSIKPHFFTTVPRLFEKIHATVLSQVESTGGLKKNVFEWAVGIGDQVAETHQQGKTVGKRLGLKWKIADKIVFSKLKTKLGGRIRMMISGGAPLPRHIISFFDGAGLLILEGYGMTEDASLSHYNRIDNYRFGTVGETIPGMDCRIADDGEILLKGDNIMKGYLGKPEETAEVLTEDGWLHTGDVGVINEEGFLTITDRKKEIIVTSGGKNVPPAPIENQLCSSRFVVQAVVFGDRRQYLVALLTLDEDYTAMWANERGIPFGKHEDLIGDSMLDKAIQGEIDRINKNLDPFSTIKKFALLPREFSIKEGELTPSLKLKRRIIEQHYANTIAGLYPGS